jgi:hypothetical protein
LFLDRTHKNRSRMMLSLGRYCKGHGEGLQVERGVTERPLTPGDRSSSNLRSRQKEKVPREAKCSATGGLSRTELPGHSWHGGPQGSARWMTKHKLRTRCSATTQICHHLPPPTLGGTILGALPQCGL